MINDMMIVILLSKKIRRGEYPDGFQNRFRELFLRIEQMTGANVNDAEKSCVIVKFFCATNTILLKLLNYFKSDELKCRLKDLADLISHHIHAKARVNLSFRISEESLDSILQAEGIVIFIIFIFTFHMIRLFYCKIRV
jgi:hypothetical protein